VNWNSPVTPAHEQRCREQPQKDAKGDAAGQQRTRTPSIQLARLERCIEELAALAHLLYAPIHLLADPPRACARGSESVRR
jgi:hypothetical protein